MDYLPDPPLSLLQAVSPAIEELQVVSTHNFENSDHDVSNLMSIYNLT